MKFRKFTLTIKAILFFLPMNSSVHGQNLVFNSNFEDVNYCTERKQACSPAAWFYITNNPLGYHKKNGNYAFALSGFGNSVHQYWQTKLADPLVPGNEYRVIFDVNTLTSELENYGFLFTDEILFLERDTMLNPPNYIAMADQKTERLKSGWFRVEKRFTASTNHQYLIVGKYKKSEVENPPSFFLDNLNVHPVNRYSIQQNSLKDSIYFARQRHRYYTNTDKTVPAQLDVEKDKIDSLVLTDLKFKFDNAEIRNPEVIEKFRSKLNPKNITAVFIYGYTDSIGSADYNFDLSQARADAVKKLLIQHYFIPANMIIAIGRGISRQFSDIDSNRRVEIIVQRNRE
jgi:outer membrane protein OmpA-like peptidoglycan-associated protein